MVGVFWEELAEVIVGSGPKQTENVQIWTATLVMVVLLVLVIVFTLTGMKVLVLVVADTTNGAMLRPCADT